MLPFAWWWIVAVAVILSLVWWVYRAFFVRVFKYDSFQYWDKRYAMSEENGIHAYEWYVGAPERLKKEVIEVLDGKRKPRECVVLDLGCGQSKLNEILYDMGFKKMYAMDFSDVLVRQRRQQQAEDKIKRPGLRYDCVDAQDMSGDYVSDKFDIIIDKASCDSMIDANDMSGTLRRTGKVREELHRVLKPRGCMVSISNNNPQLWNKFWKHPGLEMSSHKQIQMQFNGRWMNFYIYKHTKVRAS